MAERRALGRHGLRQVLRDRYREVRLVRALCSRTAKSGVKPLIALSNVARETPAASAFGQINSRNCWNSSAWDALVSDFPRMPA